MQTDSCIFVRRENDKFIFVIIYVDDLIIVSNNRTLVFDFKRGLGSKFEVKDLNEINRCLGIEFKRNEESITIRQTCFIKEILNRFGMQNSNPVTTPMDSSVKLTKRENTSEEDQKLPYREIVGSLMYLAVALVKTFVMQLAR